MLFFTSVLLVMLPLLLRLFTSCLLPPLYLVNFYTPFNAPLRHCLVWKPWPSNPDLPSYVLPLWFVDAHFSALSTLFYNCLLIHQSPSLECALLGLFPVYPNTLLYPSTFLYFFSRTFHPRLWHRL